MTNQKTYDFGINGLHAPVGLHQRAINGPPIELLCQIAIGDHQKMGFHIIWLELTWKNGGLQNGWQNMTRGSWSWASHPSYSWVIFHHFGQGMVILGYPETGSAADKNSRPGHTPCPTAGSWRKRGRAGVRNRCCGEMGENHGEVGMEILYPPVI